MTVPPHNNYAFGTLTNTTPSGGVDISINTNLMTAHSVGAFLGQYEPGSPVFCNGQWRIVSVVNDNLNLHTTTNWTIAAAASPSYNLAATYFDPSGATNLNMKSPKGTYVPYSKALPLVTGGVRGAGWKMAEWRWGFIQQADRTALRTFLTTIPSTECYILHRVYEGPDLYQWFDAQGIWPMEEDRQTGRRITFTVKWQNMIQLSAYTS